MARALLITLHSIRWGAIEELGIGYIASVLRQCGYDAEIAFVCEDLNENDLSNLKNILDKGDVILVGIGCSHSTISLSIYRQLSRVIKGFRSNVHITCGGYWATFNAEYILGNWPELDSVVMGEGEATTIELLRCLISNTSSSNCKGLLTRDNHSSPSSPFLNLDELPNPVRPTRRDSNLFSISTSRGCLAHCTFCNVPKWMSNYGGGNWRGRSPLNVVDEIQELYEQNDARRFWFVDSSFEDPFPDGIERMKEIANEILKRKLRIVYYVFFRAESIVDCRMTSCLCLLVQSGLRRVFVGVEAASDPDLRRFVKRASVADMKLAIHKLRQHGIVVRAGFIMFAAHTTPDLLRTNLAFLKTERLLHATVDLLGRLELYSGSAEVTRLMRDNLLTGNPAVNPFAYRFIDSRIEPVANAVVELRNSTETNRRWEALHTAELVVNGAKYDRRIHDDTSLRQKYSELAHCIDEMKVFQSARNEEFFEKLIQLIMRGWKRRTWNSLVDEYIDGYHLEVSQTCDALVKEFLLEMKNHGINVLY